MKLRPADAGLLYCAAVWGATFYMIKDALDGVHPVALVAHRFLLSAALLLPWVALRGRRWILMKEGAVLAAFLSVLYLSQTAGLVYTTASNSGFITGLFIFFVPLFLLVFLGRPPAPLQWAAVAVALGGLWLLTGGPREFNRGDALTILSAITYAGHLLATDRYVKADADPVLIAFHQFWMTGLACLALSWGLGASLEIRTGAAGAVIVFLAVIPTLSAFYIQMRAQKSTEPLKVSLIFSTEPVFAALFAWTLGGEPFIPSRAVGGGLIFCAMVAAELAKLPLAKAARKEVLPV